MRTPWEPVRAGLGVGLLLMLVFCNIAISAEGALRFYPPEIDFGARLTGEKVLVSTSVLNVSSDDVLIKMIKSSCHCTALKSGDMYVPSGKRLDLIFEIDGVGVNGVLENKIWILTEKPQPEVYTITVRGTFASLTNHLFANKKKLYLGVSQYRRFVRYMTLQRQGAAHLGSLTFQPSQPWIKADIVESNVTMARLRITLDVPPAITSFHEEVAAYGAIVKCCGCDFFGSVLCGMVWQ